MIAILRSNFKIKVNMAWAKQALIKVLFKTNRVNFGIKAARINGKKIVFLEKIFFI